MSKLELCVRAGRWRSLSCAFFAAFLAMLAIATLAEARSRHGHHLRHGYGGHHGRSVHASLRRGHHGRHAYRLSRGRHVSAEGTSDTGEMLSPRGVAAIVVDSRSGHTLYALNENELRHPASVTKVMTLYLLFEQLEKGALRLDSPLMISQWAAAQAPTKLGLPPGSSIAVEDAIKAVVTKSANDIAVAIAENIGGDEENFARLMTSKAKSLGMADTHFANASGLPNSQQITTARDLAVLGRAIQERFPRYYRYFSTHSFAYNGEVMRNHNHLLDRVEGMDGIKTGYTAASGFNLLSSVRRGRRHIVAVVLGGRTAAARDRLMASLIERHIDSSGETLSAHAPVLDGRNESAEAQDVADSREEAAAAQEQPLAYEQAAVAQKASAAREVTARPAFVSGIRTRVEPDAKHKSKVAEKFRGAIDGSTTPARSKTARHETAATTTPSALKRGAAEQTQLAKAEALRPQKSGWMIQLGAVDDADKANALLARARNAAHVVPATARAFTEKVQKGGETLYRARFAGLEEETATAACRSLKRSGFSCFATKN
jgi:D-alanyl-D-alanine carboxypeptidase